MPVVLLDVKNDVATLTLNRPRKGNAFSPEMVELFIELFRQVQERIDVRVIVLTGAGKYFCTGMDLSSSNQSNLRKKDAESKTGGKKKNFSTGFIQMCTMVKECTKPVIAKINGPALGGGTVLVFLSDIRIATCKAYIQFSEVNHGMVPAMISTFIVPQLGAFISKELFLTARRVSAQRAYEMNFLTAVTDLSNTQSLDEVSEEYIKYLLTSAPRAMSLVKELVGFEVENDHDSNVMEAVKTFKACLHGEEFRHGIKCRSKKQKPDWGAFYRQKQLQSQGKLASKL